MAGGLSLDAVAEDAIGWLSVGPTVARLETPEVILLHRPLAHPWFGVATRVRESGGDAGADALIDRTRRWFADRRRERFSWMIGESATPASFADRLAAAGAVVESTLTAMVLDHAPPPAPPGVEIREVTSIDGYRQSLEITADAFGFNPEARAELLGDIDASWRHWRAEPGRRYLLALLGGVPVAEAGLAATDQGPMVLSGGGTLPAARGRGAYRALVRWRWDEAVRLGASGLVVQASDDSRPILERLGFRAVGLVRTFGDRSG